jgi:hypothetical protein
MPWDGGYTERNRCSGIGIGWEEEEEEEEECLI